MYKDPKNIVFKKGSHASLFEQAVCPDKHGHSDHLMVDDFPIHNLPKFGNGSGWARDDGPLAKKYKLVKRKDERGRIISVATAGWADLSFSNQIAKEVYDYYAGQECRVLATTRNVEIDHKDGSKRAYRPVESCEEFQPLSKAANDAKRTHCKVCQQTHLRFDAKRLGYSVSFTHGGPEYRGTCVGCYWYDPKAFNAEITK